MTPSALVADSLHAVLPAAVLSGIPSTIHALATGKDPLEATYAAGTMVLPGEDRPHVLVAAGIPVHIAISLFWGAVFAATLPRRKPVIGGIVAGAAIAALDLGPLGRRFPRVGALPVLPQIADHLAFGMITSYRLSRL